MSVSLRPDFPGLSDQQKPAAPITARAMAPLLADDIEKRLQAGDRRYVIEGAQMDWVITALRALAAGALAEEGRKSAPPLLSEARIFNPDGSVDFKMLLHVAVHRTAIEAAGYRKLGVDRDVAELLVEETVRLHDKIVVPVRQTRALRAAVERGSSLEDRLRRSLAFDIEKLERGCGGPIDPERLAYLKQALEQHRGSSDAP
jgi:IS5 family transposase